MSLKPLILNRQLLTKPGKPLDNGVCRRLNNKKENKIMPKNLTKKELIHEIKLFQMGLEAMRHKINKEIDAMAARIEILLPEDSILQDGYANDWQGKHNKKELLKLSKKL
jgi:transposase InsO family protein